MKKQINFLALFFIYSALVAMIIYYSPQLLGKNIVGTFTWPLLVYFLTTTLIFHYGLQMRLRHDSKVYVRYYMAATTIKLLLHVMVIALYSSTHKETAFNFITTFLIFYVAFLIFETAIAYNELKGLKNTK